jgi:signal recognition particle receptor subunit beta
MPDHVILFAGPMGAGKTTAIRALSDIEVVATEAANTERDVVDKPTTTVALDYGEIEVSDEAKVRLYGIPGQKRFEFMWRILKSRAEGMILLVNNDAPEPVERMREFLRDFDDLLERGGIVVAVSRTDVAPHPDTEQYAEALDEDYPGIIIPVLAVDPRDRGDMRLALLSLIGNMEMRQLLSAAAETEPA